MFEANVDDVVGAFLAAKNTNAAIKNFLKKEKPSASSIARLAKDFRNAASAGKPEALRSFIEDNLTDNEEIFLALARYAHIEFVSTTVEEIINKYADQFNNTYEKTESGVKITDKKTFTSIAKEVQSLVEDNLKKLGLPVNEFMKQSIIGYVFEDGVKEEVMREITTN